MSYIAMNRFKIRDGHEEAFETMWRERESRLSELQGFQEFRLLKGPKGEGFQLYSSHVIWDKEEDFKAWTKSEQFRAAHRNAGKREGESPFMEPPKFEGFETILFESQS